MVLYKEFKVGDLFRLKSIRQIPRGFVPELKEDGEYPYLTQKTGGSYGVNGYMDETDELELIEEPMIVTGVDNVANGVMYWWDKPFYANKMLGLINENLNRERAQYVITVLLKMYMGFDYNNKINMKTVRETVIQLPVKTLEDSEPDWEYMEEYIKQKELAYIDKLNKEFEQKKEQLIWIIGEDSEYINIEELPTAKFKVLDIFEIKNGNQPPISKRFDKKEDNMVNCITGVTENNGVGFYTTRDKHDIYRNEITLSKDGEYAGTAYFQTKEFMLAGHSTGLISKYPLRKNHLLYISGVLNRYQKMGYWKQGGVMGSVTIKRLKDIDLVLPINPEVSELVPDWETMEDYVNGIKHLYLHKEESNHKEKLELLYELTGWTEQDLDNIENRGGNN